MFITDFTTAIRY